MLKVDATKMRPQRAKQLFPTEDYSLETTNPVREGNVWNWLRG